MKKIILKHQISQFNTLLIVFIFLTICLITTVKSSKSESNTNHLKKVTVKNYYNQQDNYSSNNTNKRSLYEMFNIQNMNSPSGTTKLMINGNTTSNSIFNNNNKFEEKIKRENVLLNELGNISNQNNFESKKSSITNQLPKPLIGLPNRNMNKIILDNDVLTLQNNPSFLGYDVSSQPPEDINFQLIDKLNQSEIDYDLIKHGLDMSKMITNQINNYTINKRKQEGGISNNICDKCLDSVVFCECDEIIGLENIREFEPIIATLIQPVIKEGKCIQKNFCNGVNPNECNCECTCEWILEENNSICPYNLKDLNIILCPCPCALQHQQAQKLGIMSINKEKYYKDIADKNKEIEKGKIDNLKEFLDSRGLKLSKNSSLNNDSSIVMDNINSNNKNPKNKYSIAETAGELIQQGLKSLKKSNLKSLLKS